jgi:hypothetical protein
VLFQGTASVVTSRKEVKPREILVPITCRTGETGIAYPDELALQNLTAQWLFSCTPGNCMESVNA